MIRNFVATKLKIVRPVPSDIDIAQTSEIKTIIQVAEEAGILPEELELYGPYKAKVKLEIL
jgi:methylenetetrahydrofolate dehydrogenase (NADP+)/methenyltetrahydrofolate cyclohydrolase/formyltetrahydrofolate synthetase